MKQTSSLTKHLSDVQTPPTSSPSYSQATLFSIYTEAKGDLADIASRYFAGATLSYGVGIWHGKAEGSVVITIFGSLSDLQRVIDLAGDIKVLNAQSNVLVTWSRVSKLDV